MIEGNPLANPAGGRYDVESRELLIHTKALIAAVIVVQGDRGDGFSVSATDPRVVKALPALLRLMANDIERSQQQGNVVPMKVTPYPANG